MFRLHRNTLSRGYSFSFNVAPEEGQSYLIIIVGIKFTLFSHPVCLSISFTLYFTNADPDSNQDPALLQCCLYKSPCITVTVYTCTCMSYWIYACCKEKPIASIAQDHSTITLLIIHFHCIYHVAGSIHKIDRSIY